MNELAPASILIVDDDPAVREVLRRYLELAGYVTQEAEHSRGALAKVTENEPAVAICDVEMPGQNGLWLVGQLREKYPNIAIVLCTHVDDVPPTISLQGGVVRYLLKPFRKAQVLAAVAEAVQWHRSADRQAVPSTDALEAWLKANED